jgi:hypothetical protein
MATPVLDKLNIDLSYKVFDPVDNPESDGEIYSAYLRKSYLERAYNKLLRTLNIVYHNIEELISDYYQVVEITDTSSIILDSNLDYKALYYTATELANYSRATSITPAQYLDHLAGVDSFATPSYIQRYWTIINNELKLLPEDKTMYKTILFLVQKVSLGITSGEDIEIPSQFYDLILTLSAIEAMQDAGEFAIAREYQSQFINDITLIGKQSDFMKKREETNV